MCMLASQNYALCKITKLAETKRKVRISAEFYLFDLCNFFVVAQPSLGTLSDD